MAKAIVAKADTAVSPYLRRRNELQRIKRPWDIHYQALAEIYLTRKADFLYDVVPGDFLNDQVFDNTGQFSAFLMASAFLSMLWPDSSRTFNIVPIKRLKDQDGVEKFFRMVTEEMQIAMDKPRAGLHLALMEHFLDIGVFGTSGVGAFEGPEDNPALPVLYEAWDVKAMMISENAQGFVDVIYYEVPRSIRQVYEEYGSEEAKKRGDKIAESVKEKYVAGDFETKIRILKVIEPKEIEKGKEGLAAMAVRTVHIDVDNNLIMRTSGYHEMPVFVSRMFKRTGETQGRSSGMVALPDALSLNALTEGVLVATEKQLDPPLGLLDDGRLGGGVVNTSAGALSVFKTSGRMGAEKPIFPLFTVGELQSSDTLQERLEKKIAQAFFLDRLLDLNNNVQMTAFETSVRNRLRGEALGSVFARQEQEILTPLIERTFNIMWRKGYFGNTKTGVGAKFRKFWQDLVGGDGGQDEIPTVILAATDEGLDVFEIEYISPAKRFQYAEKLQGLLTAFDALAAASNVIPEIMDNVDGDEWAQDIFKYTGAPMTGLRMREKVKEIRTARQKRQAEKAQLESGKEKSEIVRNVAQARAQMGTTNQGGK